MRIHIHAGRRWFGENTHQRGNCTSELAKHHVDAGFRSTQQIGQSAGFVVDAEVYSTFGGNFTVRNQCIDLVDAGIWSSSNVSYPKGF